MKPLNFAFSDVPARDRDREAVRFSLEPTQDEIDRCEAQKAIGFRPENDENGQG